MRYTAKPGEGPRRGWSEFVSELIIFAKKAQGMATIWVGGDKAVENLAAEIRKVPGFGGKGFRMKEQWGLNRHPVRTYSCGSYVPPPWGKDAVAQW